VIFDGHHGRLAERGRKERHAGIDVEWAVGESADSLIVRKVRHSGNPRGVEVISSDREVLRTIGDLRARGLRSTDFVARALRVLGEETGVEKPGAPSPEEIREWLDLFGTGGESER
jgi:predicted RNA-binding protein with PIN domain